MDFFRVEGNNMQLDDGVDAACVVVRAKLL